MKTPARRRHPYAVTCDRCNGKLFVDNPDADALNQTLCPKCNGDGRILVDDVPAAYTGRKALQHLFIAGLVVLVIIWIVLKLKVLS